MARRQRRRDAHDKHNPRRQKHQIDCEHALTIQIKAPQELEANYDFLQEQLTRVLSDPAGREAILSVDANQHRGNYWRDLRDALRDAYPDSWDTSWDINNPAWHARIVYENIRRLVESHERRLRIWNAAQENEGKAPREIARLLKGRGIRTTTAEVKNLKRCGSAPELPTDSAFVLDYSISDRQFCYWDEDDPGCVNLRYEHGKDSWLGFRILLPTSIRKEATGCVAKPSFTRDEDGNLVGRLVYEYAPNPTPGENVMGVDIGKVHTYTASIFTPGGRQFGPTFVDSERLEACVAGVERRYDELAALDRAIGAYEDWHPDKGTWSEKHLRRLENRAFLGVALDNARLSAARLAADEIVRIAVEYGVGEIHLEDLSWLGSLGGSWDHSRLQSLVCDRAKVDGVRVVFVNAAHSSDAHPVTGEVGRESGRLILFDASGACGACVGGSSLDRDVCSSVNLVERRGGGSGSGCVCVRSLRRGVGGVRRFRARGVSRSAGARVLRRGVLGEVSGCGCVQVDGLSSDVCAGAFIVAARPASVPSVGGLSWCAYPEGVRALPGYSSLPRRRGVPKHAKVVKKVKNQ